MPDPFAGRPHAEFLRPMSRGQAWAPDDATDTPFVTRQVRVGLPGDLRVTLAGSAAPVVIPVVAGVPCDVRVTRVFATGTTAGQVVILA